MSVNISAKWQVSSVILTSFRHGVTLLQLPTPSPQNEPLKSPTTLGLIDKIYCKKLKADTIMGVVKKKLLKIILLIKHVLKKMPKICI